MSTEGNGASVSRRAFLAGATGLWIAAGLPRPLAATAAGANAKPLALDEREWISVEAISERILPADETPGARAAGCVNFIDKALANEDAEALPLYRKALAELERVCALRWKKRFAELDALTQDEILALLEDGEFSEWDSPAVSQQAFFQTVRLHTILGFVADPKHGGNRDYIGWKTMDFPGPVHHLGGSRAEQMLGTEPFAPVWQRGASHAPGRSKS